MKNHILPSSENLFADVRSEDVSTDFRSEDVSTDVRSEDVSSGDIAEDVSTDVRSEDVSTDDIVKDVSTDVRSEDVSTDVSTEDVFSDVTTNNASKDVNIEDVLMDVNIDNVSINVNIDHVSTDDDIEDVSICVNIDHVSTDVNTDDVSMGVNIDYVSTDVNTDDVSMCVNFDLSTVVKIEGSSTEPRRQTLFVNTDSVNVSCDVNSQNPEKSQAGLSRPFNVGQMAQLNDLCDWTYKGKQTDYLPGQKNLPVRTFVGDHMSRLTDRESYLPKGENVGDDISSLIDREARLSDWNLRADLTDAELNKSDVSTMDRCLSSRTDSENSSSGVNFLSGRAEFQNYLSNRTARGDYLSRWTSMQKQLLKSDDEVDSLKTENETLYTRIPSETACLNAPNESPIEDVQSDKNKDITLAMAKEERNRQGPREAEFSFGGEADLHKHQTSCEKNPEHQNFIPRDKFKMADLPGGYRKYDFYRYINTVADLTVRVSVSYVSDSRPETFPGSEIPYPFSSNSGSYMVVHGTGWVSGVVLYPRRYYNNVPRYCECKECRDSPTPHAKFYHIYIITAAHVVFDDSEAAATSCVLFFDKGGTPGSCEGAITLSGMKHIGGDIETDWCEIRYETHDESLARRLSKIESDRSVWHKNAWYKSKDLQQLKCQETRTEHGTRHVSNEEVLTVVVSHPHGCSKQISLGYCSYIDVLKDGWTQYTYTTATCPGSSGGPVFTISKVWSYHAHSGHCIADKQLNYSSHGVDMVPQHPAYTSKYRYLCKRNFQARHERLSPGCWPKKVKDEDTTDGHDKLIMGVELMSHHSENCPSWAENCPSWAENCPSWDENCPSWAENCPSWAENCPSWAENCPSWAENCPSWAENCPSWAENCPSWAENSDITQDTSCVKIVNVDEDASCSLVTKCLDDTSCIQDTISYTAERKCVKDIIYTENTRSTHNTNGSADTSYIQDTRCTEDKSFLQESTEDKSFLQESSEDKSFLQGCTENKSFLQGKRSSEDKSRKVNIVSRLFGRDGGKTRSLKRKGIDLKMSTVSSGDKRRMPKISEIWRYLCQK